ncbi:DNA-binding transcriptional regulator [Nocardia sp. BMG51109]|uniref:helix-turn-helix domain-containing protein n=1 Tax=Nocardia sp. BMG51109 TaxID=1056816 RepID=UPI0018DE01A5|nr:hypothetical protein [Nocardia sp. BMG51109]
MQVMWTGADATALRNALGLSQPQFAKRAGISVSVVKKWKRRAGTIDLPELFAGIMSTMLEQATPEQRLRFTAIRDTTAQLASVGATPQSVEVEVIPSGPVLDMWFGDCSTLTNDLARKDLMLDRRQVSRALAGVVVGVHLLEPLERWLLRDSPGAVPEPPVIGAGLQEIAEMENTARVFREWDDQFGGGLRRKAVVGQLDEVNEILRDAHPPQIKCRLQRVLALLAETAATMSWDSGEQETAQRYYMLATRAAKEAGDYALCANAIAGMSRQLLSLDNYGTAVQRAELERDRAIDALELIRVAQDQFADRATPTVRAMLHTREAWAYSKLGRPSAFRRACDKAFDEFSNVDPTADPYWINYFDAAELSGTIGGRLLDIARRDPAFAGEAAESIAHAITVRRPKRLRSSALDQLGIVEARMIEGEFEEARRLGLDALETVGKTGSDRVRKKLVKVYNRTEQLTKVGAVAELRDRIRPIVAVAT